MTTVHAYTSDQSLAGPRQGDPQRQARPAPHARRRRSRSSRAAPARRGRSASCCPSSRASSTAPSLRVPTPTGSITDLVANLGRDVTVDDDQRRVRRSRRNDKSYRGVLEYTDEPLVSADIVGNPSSCIFSAEDTMANGKHGEGARLVRQRVGLLEPPRRPRRVRRRIAPDPGSTMPADLPRLEDLPLETRARGCWCAPTSTCRCATGTIDDDLRITHRAADDRLAARPARGRRASRAPRTARRASPTRSTRWRRSPPASASCSGREVRAGAGGRRPAACTPIAASAAPGDVVMLENLRFEPGETDVRPGVRAPTSPSSADVYVNEAFGASHRAHASIVGPPRGPAARRRAVAAPRGRGALGGCSTTPKRPFVARARRREGRATSSA